MTYRSKRQLLVPKALADAAHWSNFGIRIGLGVTARLITGYSLVDKVLNLTRIRLRTMPSQAL